MWFLNSIVSWLTSVEGFFYDAYLEVRGWVYPFYYLSYPLYSLYYAFYYLAYYFSDFNEWVDWAAGEIGNILSYSNIYSYFKPYFDKAVDTWNWFIGRWDWFQDEVRNWWEDKKQDVKGWIDIATEGFDSLKVAWDDFWTITFPSWTSKLDNLKAAWDNFWITTFPNLVNFTWLSIWWDSKWEEIGSVIDSAFTARDSLWAGWQDIKNDVIEFFTDPLQWLYDRIDTFFDRFW